jgi:DNA invertase Pin-like site-specific DNA recombinase
LDEFSALGVQFVSIGDQIDMTTASGRLMLHLIAAFAEFERAMIKERTVAGLAFARSKGKRLGRPPTRNDQPIIALRAEGLSYRAIADRLGVSRGAIYRALHSVPKTSKKSHEKIQSNRGPR